MGAPDLLRVDHLNAVATITLAAAPAGNALSVQLMERMREALHRIEADQTCRVIVLRAEGPWFCAGLDFGDAFAGEIAATRCEVYVECLTSLCRSSRPVVAAVEGDVAGGGMGLVASCDIVLAAPAARFSLPEVVVGMIPALVTPFLLRRLSPARVRALALSTRAVDAHEACVAGLVDEVATEDMARVLTRQVGRILRSSPRAIAATKRYLDEIGDDALQAHTRLAMTHLTRWVEEPEVRDGTRAFAEGFAPPWFQRNERAR
jgi:methylglutaconyl-CoA hydratase/polyketide biosynthesis enoyl-CoA hydratase PksH